MFNQDLLAKMMARAYQEAAKSPDPSNQNGAILVSRKPDGDYEVLSAGHNHFYPGIEPEVEDRDKKLQRIEHAERDAIFAAAGAGKATKGSILICPWAACYDCARAIIGAGVCALVYHGDRHLLTPERWRPAVEEAQQWMANAGIWLFRIDGPIPVAGGVATITVNGKPWNPRSCQFVGD